MYYTKIKEQKTIEIWHILNSNKILKNIFYIALIVLISIFVTGSEICLIFYFQCSHLQIRLDKLQIHRYHALSLILACN